MRTTAAELIATGFGMGRLPVAPGTWASLLTLPFAFALASLIGQAGLAAVAVALTAIGIWSSGVVARQWKEKDPRDVVIDEIAGQCLALVPAGTDLLAFLVAFIAFRVFDIAKPWPANAAQRLAGGYGIVIDDVIAGGYAALVVWGGGSLGLW
jgi:phosphatidylglycerophosphatase A